MLRAIIDLICRPFAYLWALINDPDYVKGYCAFRRGLELHGNESKSFRDGWNQAHDEKFQF